MATSIQNSRLTFCRYCLSNTNEYNRYYFLSDEQDEYQKIVLDTFNIQVGHLELFNKMICVKCAEALRLAAELKKKFMEVQKQLLEYGENFFLLGSPPKEEITSDDEKCDGDGGERDCEANDSPMLTADSENIHEQNDTCDTRPLKEEINSGDEKCIEDSNGEEIIKYDDGADRPPVATDCGKGEGFDIKIERIGTTEIPTHPKKKRARNTLKNTINKNKTKDKYLKHNVKKKANIICASDDKPETPNASLDHMKNNTIRLVTSSNMSLFKSKKTKFSCYACKENFVEITQLREHSLTHSLAKLKFNINYNRGMSYIYVDISNLICTKCSNPCHDLNELREHLKSKHDVVFEGTEHLLVPFKLKEGLQCVICQKTFSSYQSLAVHMNSHSTRNVCETCGLAFINRLSLRNHINNMHTEKKCPKCAAVFSSAAAKSRHLKTVHNERFNYTVHCNRCDQQYHNWYKLKEHKIEKHGDKPPEPSVCDFCTKKFASLTNLKIHIRAVHLREKNYPCSLCNMSFFTSSDRKRHEITHGNGKPFSCDFCVVKFRSKESVRRHLKKKHGSKGIRVSEASENNLKVV